MAWQPVITLRRPTGGGVAIIIMMKILYMLPVLAALGMLLAAYAQQDAAPPTFVSGAYDKETGVVALTFSETTDISNTSLHRVFLNDDRLGTGSTVDGTAGDSDTVTVTVVRTDLDRVGDEDTLRIRLSDDSVLDTSGNVIVLGIHTLDVIPATEETPAENPLQTVATVTITPNGTFEENVGTLEVQHGDSMTLDVKFVNEHNEGRKLLVGLISWHFWHDGADITIQPGQSATHMFTIQNDAPRIGTDNENANVILSSGFLMTMYAETMITQPCAVSARDAGTCKFAP